MGKFPVTEGRAIVMSALHGQVSEKVDDHFKVKMDYRSRVGGLSAGGGG